MAKYRKKPFEVEAITFAELIELAKKEGANMVGGMPWSFNYKGQAVSHEDDECYIVSTHRGSQTFTPRDMLVFDGDGLLRIFKKDEFLSLYEMLGV